MIQKNHRESVIIQAEDWSPIKIPALVSVMKSDETWAEGWLSYLSQDENAQRIYQFLRLVAIGQNPNAHIEAFENVNLNYTPVSGYDGGNLRLQLFDRVINESVKEKKQSFANDVKCRINIHFGEGSLGENELSAFMSNVEKAVSSANVVMTVISTDATHALACRYDADKKQWDFYDSNLLGKTSMDAYKNLSHWQFADAVRKGIHNIQNGVICFNIYSHAENNLLACDRQIVGNVNVLPVNYRSSTGRTLFSQLAMTKDYKNFDARLESLNQHQNTLAREKISENLIIPQYTTDIRPSIINARDPLNLRTALATLIISGETQRALQLIARDDIDLSVKVNPPTQGYFSSSDDMSKYTYSQSKDRSSGMTLLMIACIQGNDDIARALIQRDPDTISEQDSDGNTALHHAIKYELGL